MSGELQTIPARHGVATFVPRGRTIKIINTYGKQVVSTWAFSLNAPPQEGDDEEEVDEEEVEDVEKQVDELQKDLKEEEEKGGGEKVEKEVEKPKEEAEKGKQKEHAESKTTDSKETGDTSQEADDPPEQAPDTPENEKITSEKKPQKRTWSSYIPSMPYRSKNQNQNASSKTETKSEKEQNKANSRAWSSYLPTGKGFSSYVPNVQLPDKEGVISAFQASHYRDPNKSYAEQLYDFSKTPVGAGSLAAATGSGTASSLYAAYSAYAKSNPSKSDQPPMEYLSLPHTRAATYRLVPSVDDTLLTNLRNPLMTLIEDTSPGAHDTLTAACDAALYAALNVDKPEEHGSCAENLVLALKELNEKAGLKGTKAVGADITVNIAPTPLHLFMNAPLHLDSSAQSEGFGAKGSQIKVEESKGKKRSYVRFRAERDMVVVLSACPNEIGPQNGGRCMAANFMVEEAQDDLSASTPSLKSKKGTPKKLSTQGKKPEEKPAPKKGMPNLKGGPQKPAAVKKSAERNDSGADDPPESELPADEQPKQGKKEETKQEEAAKPKKKPKKLERRSASSATTPKSEQ